MQSIYKYLIIIGGIGVWLLCSSHDLFLKMHHYVLEPHQAIEVFLFNGTFEKSENTISRDRIIEEKIVGPSFEFKPSSEHWYDKDNITYLSFTTGGAGTYLAGISTRPRMIHLSAADFNKYLEHDGVTDVWEQRKSTEKIDRPADEQYAKHVKAIFQVGDQYTDHYQTVMGYPVEFVPLENPYSKKVGEELKIRLLEHGEPLSHVLVYAGHEHEIGEHGDDHEHGIEGHEHIEDSFRTNSSGEVTVPIDHEGIWYIRTIHMVESEKEGIDYISNWATLTFEILGQ